MLEWIDSVVCNHWQYAIDINANIKHCFTVGYIVKENESCYCIASTKTQDSEAVINVINIPKVAVIKKKSITI